LISDEDITVNSVKESSTSSLNITSHGPSVAILQTCKLINDEGTPILYSQNKFIIYLGRFHLIAQIQPTSNTSPEMDSGPSFSLSNSFLLKRWTSISYLTSLSFTSNGNPVQGANRASSARPRPWPAFHCTGADILARFNAHDFRCSPEGPDEYMALSISNWASTQVMSATLTAFQRELDTVMRPNGTFAVGGGVDDAVN
jgi:hypothetical protein